MDFKRNVSEIKRLFQERKEAAQALLRFLVSKGIAPAIAEEILLSIAQSNKGIGNFKEIIAKRIRVTGELSFSKPTVLAFIGPTGVGKTTVIQKLVNHYLKQDKKIVLMSLDDTKQAVLHDWASKQGIRMHDKKAHFNGDLLMIDTEGCNFYMPNRVETLGEQLAEISESVEIVLTLSATAKEVDLYGAIHQFSALSPSSLAFTKLDETLAAGVLVNVSARCDIAIRYISYGYPLPGNIQVADSELITHKILTDFNKEEFQFLRQLTLSSLN